jgi:hypothetical protein
MGLWVDVPPKLDYLMGVNQTRKVSDATHHN